MSEYGGAGVPALAAQPDGQGTTLREALECAEYALSHPDSDQAFALNAVRAALADTPGSPGSPRQQAHDLALDTIDRLQDEREWLQILVR